jgi:hypothetical protein
MVFFYLSKKGNSSCRSRTVARMSETTSGTPNSPGCRPAQSGLPSCHEFCPCYGVLRSGNRPIDTSDFGAPLYKVVFTWRGRATECVGFGPIGGLDRGAPCWPLRSRSSFRSGTHTAPAASVQVNCCLRPPQELTAVQWSSRATRHQSRSGCRSSTARFASSSKWGHPPCRRKRPRTAPRRSPKRPNLRRAPKLRHPHRATSSSRPERHRLLDQIV